MAIGDEDTQRALPGARRTNGSEPTPAELHRAQGYIEQRLDEALVLLRGDPRDKEDGGLRGDVHTLKSEVHTVKSRQSRMLLLLTVAVLAIAVRAIDSTGIERGWWPSGRERLAQVRR